MSACLCAYRDDACMAAHGREKQQSGHALHVPKLRDAGPGPGNMLSEALPPILNGASEAFY